MPTRAICLLLGSLVVAPPAARAAGDRPEPAPGDWPGHLGPHRNGEYLGPPLAATWPADGPPRRWSKSIGSGYAAPSVAGRRLVLFHRVGDEARIECLDAVTGDALWSTDYPSDYDDSFDFDDGPRAAPAIAGGRVFCFGAEGRLTAVDLESGKVVWKCDTRATYRPAESFFGAACSPLVEDGRVIVNVGGREERPAPRAPAGGGAVTGDARPPRKSGVVAFDAATGSELWTALDDEASYSSPVAADFAGERLLVLFTRSYVVVLDPADGSERYRKRWRARIHASVNAATPLVAGERIFATTSYGVGALLLRHTAKGSFEEVWSNDASLSSHFATPVEHDGFLYGFHGRQEGGTPLRCVELASGSVRWSEAQPATARFGTGSLILAGDRLVMLSDEGELLLAVADPAGFRRVASASILGSGIRAHAALAHGRYYARDKSRLVCVDLAAH